MFIPFVYNYLKVSYYTINVFKTVCLLCLFLKCSLFFFLLFLIWLSRSIRKTLFYTLVTTFLNFSSPTKMQLQFRGLPVCYTHCFSFDILISVVKMQSRVKILNLFHKSLPETRRKTVSDLYILSRL